MLPTWTPEDIDSIVSDVDPGIARAVRVLMEAQVETFEACQGGPDPSRPDRGHAYSEPTVRFHGGPGAGWLALSALLTVDLPVESVRRIWPIHRGEPTGPHWEVTFSPSTSPAAADDAALAVAAAYLEAGDERSAMPFDPQLHGPRALDVPVDVEAR